MSKREAELRPMAEALGEVIVKTFEEKGAIKFAVKPTIERRDIIEWNRKLRINGMEKFNGPAIISFVNYYLSEQDKQKNNAVGAVIIFVAEDRVASLLGRLGYPKIDDENESEIQDGCGKLCHDIGLAFKEKIANMGYRDLVLSAPENYRNNVPQGVNFSFKEYDKFELSFSLEDRKVLVAEMTMGIMQRVK